MTYESSSCDEYGAMLGEGPDRVVTADATFCRACFENLSAQVRHVVAAQGQGIDYQRAILGAVLGGAVGVLIWWGFTVVTKVSFGLVAVVIGIAVGKGILYMTGGRRARNLQIISVIVAVVGFVYASYLVNRTFILQAYADQGITLPLAPDLPTLYAVVHAGFTVIDLVFLGIVGYQAWKIPAPFQLAGQQGRYWIPEALKSVAPRTCRRWRAIWPKRQLRGHRARLPRLRVRAAGAVVSRLLGH